MPRTSKSSKTLVADHADRLADINMSLDDHLIELVTDFIEGRTKEHILIAGGFGTGKSRAVGIAAVTAAVAGARIARLEQGPIGISSFDDFLAAVNDALGSEVRPAPGSDVASISGVNVDTPLVIVVEGLDQLVRQMRAADRPEFAALLADEQGPLMLGTTILGVLPEEFVSSFTVLRTAAVASPADGIQIALERAKAHRILPTLISDELLNESRRIDLALLGNQAFWALAGDNLAAGTQRPLVRAESELRALMRAHFSALLLRIAPSEQRVLLEIARAGAPRTVQEIAEATDVRNQAAASALARLHADGWVATIPAPDGADRRRSWYEITDPLLRLHLRPQGTGSVTDLIRSLVEVWHDSATPSHAPFTTEEFDQLDSEAARRGEAGEPEVARAWFQDMLLRRAEAYGLQSKATLDAYWTLAVWVGNSGDRIRSHRMLSAVIQHLDGLFGQDSHEAIKSRLHAARNLVEMRTFADAEQLYLEASELAVQSGQLDLAAQAMLGLGQTFGEQRQFDQAVQHAHTALEYLRNSPQSPTIEQKRIWAASLNHARRNLAHWLARGRSVPEALAVLEDSLSDPYLSERDRYSVVFDRLEIVALVDRADAVAQYLRLATDIDASGTDVKLARAARIASFSLAVDEWPSDPARWPIRAVEGQPIEAATLRLLQDGLLDLQGVAKILMQVSGAQARSLATRLVATPAALAKGQRTALARTAVPHLRRAAEQRLFADLASALDGDPSGEANLPEEWRQMVAEMRQLDFGQDAR